MKVTAFPQSEKKVKSKANFISQEELFEFSKRNNFLAARHIILRVSFHIIFGALAYYAFTIGDFLLGLLFLIPHCAGMSFFGWAGIGHELSHNSVFTSKYLNRILFRLFSIITWNNYSYFKISHPIHHRETLSSNDIEGAKINPLKVSDVIFLLSFDIPALLRRLHVLISNSLGIVSDKGNIGKLFGKNTISYYELCSGARYVLIVQFSLILIFCLLKMYWLIIIVNLSPFILTFFNRTLAAAQHYGLSKGEHKDYLTSTRTIILGPILTFFYAGMNYHVEHHYYPGVPFYRLRELNKIIMSRTDIPHLSKGYLDAIYTMAKDGIFGFYQPKK